MQAVKHRQRDYESLDDISHPDTEVPELAPPPAPFPTDSLTSSEQVVDLNGIQTACIAALSFLLPDSAAQTASLSDQDTLLASTLTELLEVCYELEDLDLNAPDAANGHAGDDQNVGPLSDLTQVLTVSQATRAKVNSERNHDDQGFVAGEAELGWTRLDHLMQAVLRLVDESDSSAVHGAQQESVLGNGSQQVADADQESLPPRYSFYEAGHLDQSTLPGYDDHAHQPQPIVAEKTSLPSRRVPEAYGDEKMLHELDSVTSAIERLQHVAPQLNDQRVEAGPSRLRDVSQARARMERDKMRELEEIWGKIERAHMKRGIRERVDMERYEERRAARREAFLRDLLDQSEARRLQDQDSTMIGTDLDLARARDLRDRDHFLHDLANGSSVGRLDKQDAEVVGAKGSSQTRREAFLADLVTRTQAGRLNGQDYQSLNRDMTINGRSGLTAKPLDDSGADGMDEQVSRPSTPRTNRYPAALDPNEIVTVGDFFRDQPHPDFTKDTQGNGRSRSASGSEVEAKKGSSTFGKLAELVKRRNGGVSSKMTDIDLSAFAHIAEHQENLRSVTITVHGHAMPLDLDWRLECGSQSKDDSAGVTDAIIFILNNTTQLEISLPTPVHPSQTVHLRVVGDHLEGKITALPTISETPTLIPVQALSAADLRSLGPKALCCTYCDRDIAALSRASKDGEGGYKDLPSEYWAEMMEVWMCHADPAWTAKIAARSKEGFWPSGGKVLVGGSYLLVNPEDVKLQNLFLGQSTFGDEWSVARCSCGEVLGKQRSNNGKPGAGTVRFTKWSVGLLREDEDGERVEPVKVPLSVFVVADMLELAQAHATHRFIIIDEASGEDHILIWLFNPSIRLSFHRLSSLLSSSSPPSGSRLISKTRRFSSVAVQQVRTDESSEGQNIRVAKVMYKVMGSASGTTGTIPGFGEKGQVERLAYPRDVCVRLAAILQDSTTIYPVSKRKMGGYDVGFLERA